MTDPAMGGVTAALIDVASSRIAPFVHRTPVMTSRSIDAIVGGGMQVFFKCENLQKTGSFKARGATNAVKVLMEGGNGECGVVTHSSGNHGAALAYAAKEVGIPCTVVVPSNAPAVKVQALRAYGATIVECEPTMAARESACAELVSRTGSVFVHPHNNYQVMCGQGTIAKELLEEIPHLDAIIVPLGGGGMASGIARYVHERRPECRVYLVEPKGKETEVSLRAGTPLWPYPTPTLDTVADGMRVGNVADKCFPVLRQCAEWNVLTVNDEQIVSATNLVWHRLKQMIEPSSGTGIAALLHQRQRIDPNVRRVAVVLCGGNVDAQFTV